MWRWSRWYCRRGKQSKLGFDRQLISIVRIAESCCRTGSEDNRKLTSVHGPREGTLMLERPSGQEIDHVRYVSCVLAPDIRVKKQAGAIQFEADAVLPSQSSRTHASLRYPLFICALLNSTSVILVIQHSLISHGSQQTEPISHTCRPCEISSHLPRLRLNPVAATHFFRHKNRGTYNRLRRQSRSRNFFS